MKQAITSGQPLACVTLWEASVLVDMSAAAHAPVLIVDDDDDVRESLCLAAEADGFRVAEAASIDDACRFLRAATSGHIVFLDFLLPPENADALLRLLPEDAALRRHRFVLMPANPTTRFSDESQALIARWCDEVIIKPFDLTTMLACIERAEARLAQPQE